MAELQDQLEIDRLRNLTQGFGWEVVQQEFTDTHIVLTLKKPRVEVAEVMGIGPT